MFSLKSIYIKEYKNIRNQKFDFSTNTGYIALIGLNGSGKSNLLEAISLIFDELYGIPATEQVKGYTIKYELGGAPYVYTTLDEQNNVIPLTKGEKICPSNVIACYSGEDLRLWHIAYENYYMQYFRDAIRDKSFSPRIVYINKYCWKIALISLLCSSKLIVREFLKNILSIDDVRSVEIHLDADEEKRAKFADHTACRWYDYIKHLQDDEENHIVNANVIATTDMMTYGAPNAEAPNYIFQFLFLLALPGKNEEKGQTVDKLITDISITIDGVSFDNLSEGEKKMILIECITQVLGNDNSLVLLDEPDSHVHIERKTALLGAITAFRGQTILTTHSPIFTNLMENDNIFPIENGTLMSQVKQDLIKSISGRELDVINGACVVNSKYIIITEGSSDIYYLQQAIKALQGSHPQLRKFDKVGFLPQGSADHSESFYNDVVSKLPNTVLKILYLFDNDKPGHTNAIKMQNKPKVSYLFYQPDYNRGSYLMTYYVEDYFPQNLYGKQLKTNMIPQPLPPNLQYHQIKEIISNITSQKNITATIKTNIETSTARYNPAHYNNFLPLLNEILKSFGL